jgi:hypothetical protein
MSQTALALFGEKTAMPAHLMAAREDHGAGNEAVSTEDMGIPVLSLLQSTSDELETVEGARAGMFCNSITKELMTSVFVINLLFRKTYAVFRKRTHGGGFHGTYNTEAEAIEKRQTLPGDLAAYDIVETGEHVLLLLDKDGVPQHTALMRFKSTGLAASRTWNSELNLTNEGAARFATVWELTPLKKSNDKGTWYLPKPAYAGWAGEELYKAAKTAYLSMTGQVVEE